MSADSFVRAMVEVGSKIETECADKQPIKAKITPEYTELEKRLVSMFCENTGCNMLDSGGIYGRAWQQNRNIVDWNKLPEINVKVYSDGDYTINVSAYHFLKSFLDITEKSEQYNIEFQKLMESNDDCGLVNMREFANNNKMYDFKSMGTSNTYNFETLLDHVLQYVIFEDDEGDQFIILQLHLGADIRGGYSKPVVFALPEFDYFCLAMSDVGCRCEKCGMGWYSDDAGYHWYYSDCFTENKSLDGKQDTEFNTYAKNEKLYHKNCKGEITFIPRLEW